MAGGGALLSGILRKLGLKSKTKWSCEYVYQVLF